MMLTPFLRPYLGLSRILKCIDTNYVIIFLCVFLDLPKPDATFVEKLITNIIKNVQLTVRNIHIRYEDKVTNPNDPFALGITLKNLIVESTDENWKKAIVEDISKIYKVSYLLYFLYIFNYFYSRLCS